MPRQVKTRQLDVGASHQRRTRISVLATLCALSAIPSAAYRRCLIRWS